MIRIFHQTLRSSINRTVMPSVKTNSSVFSSSLPNRKFALSSNAHLKEIEKVIEGDITTIEGKIIPSERAPFVLRQDSKETGCTLCKIHPHIKYTDVLILSQFLREDGCLLPAQVTGVCWAQQQRLKALVNKAQRAGLLPQFRPALASGKVRTNHRSNYKWKRYNVHFKD